MIYFIENRQARTMKIGYAADPMRRLRQLQTANSNKLRLVAAVPGSLADEHRVRVRFVRFRVRGEWFRDTPELREYISACLASNHAIHGERSRGRVLEAMTSSGALAPGERFPLPVGDEWPRYAQLAAQIEATVELYVGFPVDIYQLSEPWWSGVRGRPLSYQVEPSDGAGYGEADSARFWEWFAAGETPCFPSVVQAADAFVDAWDYWNEQIRLRRVTG